MISSVRLANVVGVVSIILWSASALAVIMTDLAPPFFVLSIVSLGNFLFYLGKWIYNKESPLIHVCFTKKSFWVTALGITIYMMLYISAFKLASPIEVNLINYLWPILLVIMGSLFFKFFCVGPLEIMGVFLGFAGVYLIFEGQISFDHRLMTTPEATGYGLIFLAALLWAFYSCLTRLFPANANHMGYVYLFMALIAAVFHFLFEEAYKPSAAEWCGIGFLTVIQFGYAGWDYAMKQGSVKLLSSLIYLVPIISTMLLLVFIAEPVSSDLWLSIILVLGGCSLVNLRRLIRLWQKQKIKKEKKKRAS